MRRAKYDGRVRPAGRRYGTSVLMWRRTDLDRFLLGLPPLNEGSEEQTVIDLNEEESSERHGNEGKVEEDSRKVARPNEAAGSLAAQELGKLVPFADFMAADLLLFLRGHLESSEATRTIRWRAWSDVYLERWELPRFLIESPRRTVAVQLATALGVGTADELRERFVDRAQNIIKSLGSSQMFDTPLQDFKPAEIGTR